MSATAVTAAIVERGGAPFNLQSVELSGLQTDEVRVRIVASAIVQTGAGGVMNVLRPLLNSPVLRMS